MKKYFEELSRLMETFKAQEESMTQEEKDWQEAQRGFDDLASLDALLSEAVEPIMELLENRLLSKHSEMILSRLYQDMSEFHGVYIHHVGEDFRKYTKED